MSDLQMNPERHCMIRNEWDIHDFCLKRWLFSTVVSWYSDFLLQKFFATEIVEKIERIWHSSCQKNDNINSLPANPTAMASTIDKSGTVPKLDISKEIKINFKALFTKKKFGFNCF